MLPAGDLLDPAVLPLATQSALGALSAVDKAKLDAIIEVLPTLRPLDALMATFSAAWSVSERLRAAYAGPACTVRRSSDNTSQDIGFTAAGRLDEAALTAFCGAGSGYVTTVYDQSGNGRDLTQPTTGTQPAICVAGVVQKDGANVVTRATGSQYLMRADSVGITGTQAFTAVHLGSTNGSDGGVLWQLGTYPSSYTTAEPHIVLNMYQGYYVLSTYTSAVRYDFYPTAYVYSVVQHAAGANLGSYGFRVNGVQKSAGAAAFGNASAVANINGVTQVGGTTWSTSFFIPATLTAAQLAVIESWLEARRTGGSFVATVPVLNADLIQPAPLAIAYAASVTLSLSLRGDFVLGPLTGNAAVSFTGPFAGRHGMIVTKQDATGGRTLTWSAPAGWAIVWLTATGGTGANATAVYEYRCVSIAGTNYILMSQLGQAGV